MPLAIHAEGLTRRFGDTLALDRLDLAVEAGTVLGLLGHNGAGKTTAVRILTTLLAPDAGTATIEGLDVVRDAAAVRERIAFAGQQATLDELLTGRENLMLLGRLQKLSARAARARAVELLERFDVADAADRPVSTYSGGMRRRLDLAACLMVPRPVVFLDEPTTGLDPISRVGMWDAIRELVAAGSTLVLTTQYLEEADQLADRIVVLAGGRVVAEGTAAELKDRVGERTVEAVVARDDQLEIVAGALTALGLDADVDRRGRRVTAPAPRGADDLSATLEALAAAGIAVEEAGLRRPTLDDAFFALTHEAPEEAAR